MQIDKRIIESRGVISEDTPVLLKIEHDKYDPEKISCEVHLLSEEKKHYVTFRNHISGDEFGNLIIKAVGEDHFEIILNGTGSYSLSGKKAALNIHGYEYAISDSPIKNPKHIYLDVELTPSGILGKWGHRTLNYNGSIEIKDADSEDIEWELPVGKGKAFVRYNYEDHSVFDNKAIVQIERPVLFYDIDVSQNLSTKSIKDLIQEEIRDICLILSLCYRKTVSWYELSFTLFSDDKDTYIPQPIIRRKVYHKTYPEYEDELINHRDLINDGLSNLVCALRNSPLNESLRRSIIFLSSSESDNTIEVKYFLCVISLESFCDGYIENSSEEIKIPSNKWKKIEKILRRSLDDLSKEPGYSSAVETVKNKFPELKSITTFDKIIYCCEKLNLNTDDLWVRETFEQGLSRSLQMRNHLFHRAYCDEPFELYKNCIRLQILTERLLLRTLDWPDEKIWRWYDQKLRRIN